VNRRFTLLVGVVALAVTVAQATATMASAATPEAARQPGPRTDRGTDAQDGLDRLRDDATGKLRVHRAADGAVDFVSSTNGHAMLEDRGAHGPTRTAADQLARYGEAFGIDGDLSRAVVKQTLDSGTGGSVVRSEQVVDGVPVFGGQVVMSLDEDQGLVSVTSATTDAMQVPAAEVSEQAARGTALGTTARSHQVSAGSLSATSVGRRLYDPAIVHTSDPLGARPVWEFEVTNGFDVRETVLVGTGRGEVALHFNDSPELNRRICDNGGVRRSATTAAVPICVSPARTEGGASSVADVDNAYANLGESSQAYADLDGIDLTNLIGATVASQKTLQSTVRWCYTDLDTSCPYDNAFWDGTQMVFGTGYAGADDVVGHELTHGYVERTSNLFTFHQSGAINESVADTIGEVVDHRNGVDSDTDWTMGEDLPGGAIRSMKTPTSFGQPDKMTSPNFVTADFYEDNGAVHANDGVGNKAAYLISQGGTFNGLTVTGIDNGDPGLAKTGLLYLEVIPRLTSGSEYADLGRVLGSTCDELAASSTGGFTSDDCASVRSAATATELSSAPTSASAAAPEAPISCPAGNPVNTVIARDDDGIDDFDFSFTTPQLWERAPGGGVPSYAVSGTESLFGLDPDPSLGDPASGAVTAAPFTVPAAGGGTYLNFHHAYVLDYDDSGFYDGGRVVVSKLVNGSWVPVNGLPWVNGPTKHIVGGTAAGFTGFGGDSHGYGSSQVDLSSLAGQRVQVAFRLEGDSMYSLYGWWIDDVGLYACDTAAVPAAAPVAPSAPTTIKVNAGASSAVVSWGAPSDAGSTPVTSYRVTRSDGQVTTLPSTSRSTTLTGFNTTAARTVTVTAINAEALVGSPATVSINPTVTSVTSSSTKVTKGRAFTVTGKVVRRGSTSVVSGMPLTLQRHLYGKPWSNLSTGTSGSHGTKAWSVKQSARTSYRVIAKGVTTWFGSTSSTRTVAVR
jgi:bacillolysin